MRLLIEFFINRLLELLRLNALLDQGMLLVVEAGRILACEEWIGEESSLCPV